jgi:hypothetical protein
MIRSCDEATRALRPPFRVSTSPSFGELIRFVFATTVNLADPSNIITRDAHTQNIVSGKQYFSLYRTHFTQHTTHVL